MSRHRTALPMVLIGGLLLTACSRPPPPPANHWLRFDPSLVSLAVAPSPPGAAWVDAGGDAQWLDSPFGVMVFAATTSIQAVRWTIGRATGAGGGSRVRYMLYITGTIPPWHQRLVPGANGLYLSPEVVVQLNAGQARAYIEATGRGGGRQDVVLQFTGQRVALVAEFPGQAHGAALPDP